jgi:hypothetical protein
MGRMKRWRFTLAALAGLLLLSGLGSASASAPIGTAEKGPLTTGRALIDVRTPELPPLRGLGAKQRQRPVLAESQGLLDRVVGRSLFDQEGEERFRGWDCGSPFTREGASAQAIRPPTVPPGTSRLRLTTMATHRIADLRRAAELIGNAAGDLGLSAPPARDPPLAA